MSIAAGMACGSCFLIIQTDEAGMSLHLMNLAWNVHSVVGPAKVVLIRLCSMADDAGGRLYPGVPRLAADCGLSDRSVQRALSALSADGYLTVAAEANTSTAKTRSYQIQVEKLTSTPVTVSPVTESHRCQRVTRPVTESHPTGDRESPNKLVKGYSKKKPPEVPLAADATKPAAPTPVMVDPETQARRDSAARTRIVGLECLRICGWHGDPSKNWTPVSQWLADGADPDRDIYPTIQRIMDAGKASPGNLSYFTRPITDALARHRQNEDSAIQAGNHERNQWIGRMKGFQRGLWLDSWGPKPGERGCQCPADIAAEMAANA